MSAVINNNVNSISNFVDCQPHGDCEININDNLTDDSRKIFVGGLSWETNEEDLRKYFSEFGLVKSCIIKLDRYTSHSRGFGFVIFDSEDTVNKVLEIKEHILNKKKIDPKKAKPSREPQKKIFVGGLDPDLSESMIKNYFSQFGEIENIESPFDTRKNKRKAYLFITFSNELEARKATAQESQEIDGKKFEVRIAIPREQANRRWKGVNSNMFYPYAMLPYIYPDIFYSYVYNNPSLYSAFYNPYELLGYDPINLSRQFSTGVMINNSSNTTTASPAATATITGSSHRQKITPNNNNQNGGQNNSNNISKRTNPFIPNIDNHSVNQSLPNGSVCMSQPSHSATAAVATSRTTTTTTSTNQNVPTRPNDCSMNNVITSSSVVNNTNLYKQNN